jgi:signal transduction histidine kinase
MKGWQEYASACRHYEKGSFVKSKAGSMPLWLILPRGERPARWTRPLSSAGWRVALCTPQKILGQYRRQEKTLGGPPFESNAPSLSGPIASEELREMRALLRNGIALSPEIKAAAALSAEPERSGFRRLAVAGIRGRSIPEFLLWREYPVLRTAIEKNVAMYVPDGTVLFTESGKENWREGCLCIPIPWADPKGVLLLLHAHGAALPASFFVSTQTVAQGLAAMFKNIALQNRLKASELRYRSILSAAPFLIALLNSDGTVLEINPQLVHELKRQGISPRRAMGANVLQSRVLPAELRTLLDSSVRSGQGFTREEVSLMLPRGAEMIRLHIVPLRSGNTAGELLVIAEIITHYHQLMDEAERNERLAAIGRVAASLAHEVNNPLQALRSHLELIRSYPLNDEEREQSFGILEREVERLDEITRRVLGFARPTPDILQPVSILGVLDQALALSRNYLQHQAVTIRTDIPEGLPPVLAAPGQLIQVFLNIILNAAHAMRGCGTLSVRVASLGNAVEIVFENDGPPIPADQMPHIFEPFYTTHPEGTGLGLSISHAILQRHKGTIRAENLPRRRGVAFTLTLPFALEEMQTG